MYSIYYFSVAWTDIYGYESFIFLLRSSLSKKQATEYIKVCNEISSCYLDNVKPKDVTYPHYFMTKDEFKTFKYFNVKKFSRVGPLPKFMAKQFENSPLDKAQYVNDSVNVDKEYGFVILGYKIDENKYKQYIEIIQNMGYTKSILKNALMKCFFI